jgi:uncharacterized membrane protein
MSAIPLQGAPLLAYVTVAAGFALASLWFAEPPMKLGSYVAAHLVLLFGLGGELVDWAAARVLPENARNAQSLAVSLLCAVYAVALVGAGVALRSVVNRILGLALIGFVILKLYFYDVWELRLLYRVAAFGALGVLLLVTSFLYSRFRGSIESWWQNEGRQ